MSGVLVFVEQHHPVGAAQASPDRRIRLRQPGGGRHLRAEVHHTFGPHPLMQRLDQRHQFRARRLRVEHLAQRLVGFGALAGPGGR